MRIVFDLEGAFSRAKALSKRLHEISVYGDFFGVNEIPTIVSNFYKKLILTIGLFRWLIIIQCYCYKKSVR